MSSAEITLSHSPLFCHVQCESQKCKTKNVWVPNSELVYMVTQVN